MAQNISVVAMNVKAFYSHSTREWGNIAHEVADGVATECRATGVALAELRAARKSKDKAAIESATANVMGCLLAFYSKIMKRGILKRTDLARHEMMQGSADGRRVGVYEIMHRIKELKGDK